MDQVDIENGVDDDGLVLVAIVHVDDKDENCDNNDRGGRLPLILTNDDIGERNIIDKVMIVSFFSHLVALRASFFDCLLA